MELSGLRLRQATAADAVAVADVYLRARKANPGIPALVHNDAEVLVWFQTVVLPTAEVWVTSLDRPDALPAAMIVLGGEWIEHLYVAPEHQGQGHGSVLLAVAQRSRARLSLWTFESNAPARRFYERHGFAVQGQPSCENEEQAPALRYVWELGS